MKIALISPYDYAYPGGVTSHIDHLKEHFLKEGHVVKVLTPYSGKGVRGQKDIIPLGIPFPLPTSGSIARIALSPLVPFQLRKVLEQEKFDVLHLHEPLTPMLPLAALYLSNTATVGTFHAFHGSPKAYILGKVFLRNACSQLHCRIAVSRPAMEFVQRCFPGDYRVIPNGVDLDRFNPRVEPLEEFNDGKVNLLFIGRLEKRKGLKYLLEAYQQIKAGFPLTRLIVVGPGVRLRRKYEKMVEKNKLKDVVFTGYIGEEELARYYSSAHIFCAPATGQESFGIVLLEAMAMGRPVVASDIDGYASLLKDGEEGILVPPRDSRAIATALSLLLQDGSLRRRMGDAGRLKAREYSWDLVAQQVMECYLGAIEKHRGHREDK